MKKHLVFLIPLFLFALAVRIPYLYNNVFAFMFDHGKDAIAVLHMVRTHSLKFIGPWTSISGLHFGPGWYYLLAPGVFLSQGNPAASVVTMILLVFVQMFIAYKLFGKIEAFLMAATSNWIMLSQSAWNPHPMTFVTFLILVCIAQIRKNGITYKNIFFLGASAALGFHFSSAFAILYPIIIGLILLLRKKIPTIRQALVGIGGFIVPWIPQILFELKNNFLELRSVLKYISEPHPSQIKNTVWDMAKTIFGGLRISMFPDFDQYATVHSIVSMIALACVGLSIYRMIRKKIPFYWLTEVLVFLVVPTIAFSFLPFQVWYIAGLAPIAVIIGGHMMRQLPKPLLILFCTLIALTPIAKLKYYHDVRYADYSIQPLMLSTKLKTIESVEAYANGRQFSSYQYVPDLYDYPYQYIYMWRGMHGHPLPVEFSYAPGEILYITEKPELLTTIPAKQTGPAELIFYIVEKPQNQNYLRAWWDRQQYGEIIDQYTVGDGNTVYVATPKKQETPKE